jgi:hypothetical protein
LTYQQPPAQYGPPPGYPPQYGQAPAQPPAPQGAKGTLDDFYGQPSTGGGKGISWKDKQNGYRYVGVVKRTPVDADVFQDAEPPGSPNAGKLKTWRDGSPKLVMPVQLVIAHLDQFQQFTYPEHDASVFLRGAMKEEVTRAMQEAGASGVPQQGALMDITLTHRKPGNNIASNVYAVVYRPAGTWETDPAYAWVAQALAQPVQQATAPQAPAYGAPYNGAPQQAPYQQQAPAQYAAPAQAAPNPQQYAQPGAQPYGGPAQQPQYGGQAYDPNTPQGQFHGATGSAEYGAPPAQQFTQATTPQAPEHAAPQGYAPQPGAESNQQYTQQQLPIQTGPAPAQPGVQGPALNPAQQNLLARMTGGGQQAAPSDQTAPQG